MRVLSRIVFAALLVWQGVPPAEPQLLLTGVGGAAGFATPTYVNGGQCDTGGFSCNFGALSLTAGNVVVVGFTDNNAGTLSVTDNGSGAVGTWTSACGPYTSGSSPQNMKLQIFWAKVNSSASVTITANDTSNTNEFIALGSQYSGVNTTNPVDQCPVGNYAFPVVNNTTASTGTTATTTQTEELLVSLFGAQDSVATYCSETAGSGYTIRQCRKSAFTGIDANLEDTVVSVTGAYTGTITWKDPLNSNYAGVAGLIVTLKAK